MKIEEYGRFPSTITATVAIRKRLVSANLECIPFHVQRYSTTSLLLSPGVHPKVMQEHLGHSTISMTLDISYVIPPTYVEVA